VDDEPDVRSVDAHTKGDGGHDDVDAFVHELVLVVATVLV